MAIELIELIPHERSRTYVFSGNEKLIYLDVCRLKVSDSGNHRLELGDGRKIIVMAGWLAIELDVDSWTL